MAAPKVGAAIIGPGNIGTDLLTKLMRSDVVEVRLMSGIVPDSPGLQRAAGLGIDTSADGVEAVLERDDIEIVFDATAAQAHIAAAPRLREAGKREIDLTSAAIGPYVVPAVNLEAHLDFDNVNMVSCGGQATIPFVHAIDRVANVAYAEIVATISSASAGPGTRQNIDHFTETTAAGIEAVGGADEAKAIIILNPADPPIMMRDTIFARVRRPDAAAIQTSVEAMLAEIAVYVPGTRLVLCETDGDKVRGMSESRCAEDFPRAYAGNLESRAAPPAGVGEGMAHHLAGARA